jgi:soluble lytic murein transglycosylase-like protein
MSRYVSVGHGDRHAGRWALIAMACSLPIPAFAAAAGCEPMATNLSPAQRSKFHVTIESCKAPGDAKVLTDALATPSPRAAARTYARHLQLFDTPDALALRDATTPVAVGPAAMPATRRTASARQPVHTKQMSASASGRRALSLAPDVDAVARQHDIDPLLLHAIAHVESRHNADARSPAGARGVMQVMPATAQRFGVATTQALLVPRINLEVSATYLKTLQRRFGNDLVLVLAAYNAGEGAVEKHGRRVPPFAETQGYVRQVLEHYRMLSLVARGATGSIRSDL